MGGQSYLSQPTLAAAALAVRSREVWPQKSMLRDSAHCGSLPLPACTWGGAGTWCCDLPLSGSPRALKALWSYLSQKGVNSEAIWEKIKDIVVKTIIA